MTNIPSGYFTTPSNTPLGTPKVIAVDNPYLTKDELITNEMAIGLGLTSASAVYVSGRLDRILLSASAEVNRICRRWFDTQTIDETQTGVQVRPYNPQLVNVRLQNSPYQKIHTIFIQVLKWFIQIDTTQANGYLQDFPDYGYYRIVPLLSNSGTGAGSPMPAEIVDKTPLGVIWTNYTFGYGKPLTAQVLTQVGATKAYQAALYLRLFAPSETLNVYDGVTLLPASDYTVDYPNGIITFISSYSVVGAVTADYTSNEAIPYDIKQAVALIALEMYGQGLNNALGADSYSIQTYSVSFGKKVREQIDRLLAPYQNNMPVIF